MSSCSGANDAATAGFLFVMSAFINSVFVLRKRFDEQRHDLILRRLESLRSIIDCRRDDKTSVQVLLDTVMKSVENLVDSHKVSIYLCDENSHELYLIKSLDDLQGLTLSFGEGIAGKCAETGEVQRVDDTNQTPYFFKPVDDITGFQSKSILCVPVGPPKASPIAVIQLVNKKDGGTFTDYDEESLTLIAAEFFLALRSHARDYFELKTFGRRIEYDAKLESSLLIEYGIEKLDDKKYRVVNKMKVLSKAILAANRFKKSISETDPIDSEQLEKDILNYNFNPLEADNSYLILLIMQMFCHYDLFHFLSIDADILKTFLEKASTKYNTPPFHHFKHAFGVTHLSFQILKHGADKYLSPIEIFAVLISAVCHDIDHPGNNNQFEIVTRSRLALLYSDDSVLERHHSATTLALLNDPETDILKNLPNEDKTYFRRLVVGNILATDMAHHFALVDKLNAMVCSNVGFDSTNLVSRKLLMGTIIHSADIGAQTQIPDVANMWTERIVAEFKGQVKSEMSIGLEPTAFMSGLENEQKKYRLQSSFIGDIILPLWTALAELLPELKPYVAQATSTRDDYAAKSKA